jgi:hypothetical protein
VVRSAALIFVVALLSGCSANPGKQVPREAANAMTGSPETLTAVTSLTLIGTGTDFEPDKVTVASFKRVMNFRRGQLRQDQTVLLDAVPERRLTGVEGKISFDVDDAGRASVVDGQEASLRRAELLHHPLGFLLAVFSRDAPLSNTRREASLEAVDITVDGVTYSLFIDDTTKLPVKIASKIGSVAMETSFDKYVNLHGYKLPSRFTTKIDQRVTEDLNIEQQFAGPDGGTLPVPPEIKKP